MIARMIFNSQLFFFALYHPPHRCKMNTQLIADLPAGTALLVELDHLFHEHCFIIGFGTAEVQALGGVAFKAVA